MREPSESFEYELVLNENKKMILNDHNKELSWSAQKTSQVFEYELWENDQLVNQEKQDFKLNWYGVQEMRTILEDIGFKSVELFGDYNEFDPNGNYEVVSFKAYR